MSMILTKIQFDRSTSPSEFVSGETPVVTRDGQLFLKDSNKEVKLTDEGTFTLEQLAETRAS